MGKYFVPGVAPLREAFQLASFVPNLAQAEQDVFPSPRHQAGVDYPELVVGVDYRVQPQTNLGRFFEEYGNRTFAAKVMGIVAASLGRTTTKSNWLEQCEVCKYTLVDPKRLFHQLLQHEAARVWLQDEIEDSRRTVYFVVGFYTVRDAVTHMSTSKDVHNSAEATVPVAEIATHGAAALLGLGSGLDVGGSFASQTGRSAAHSTYQPGERVYAFCYRKVCFSFFSPRDQFKLKQDNCWVLTADNRGRYDDSGENSEGVEALLQDGEDGEDSFAMLADELEDEEEEEEDADV